MFVVRVIACTPSTNLAPTKENPHINPLCNSPSPLGCYTGTLSYLAPEVLKYSHGRVIGVLGPPIDAWALGVTYFALLQGNNTPSHPVYSTHLITHSLNSLSPALYQSTLSPYPISSLHFHKVVCLLVEIMVVWMNTPQPASA